MARVTTRAALAAALLGTLLALIAHPGAVSAQSTDPQVAADAGAGWLARGIGPDGSFNGTDDEVGAVTEAALALAAAEVGGDAFERAVDYVATHYQDWVTDDQGNDNPGRLGRVAMLAVAAGRDPRAFGGTDDAHDLVTRIRRTRTLAGPDAGMYGAIVNAQAAVFLHSLGMLGLEAAGAAPHDQAVAWLSDQQCPDGGWTAYRTALQRSDGTCGDREIDASGMAVQALAATGATPDHNAADWLHSVQHPSGGFSFWPDSTPNANSTALAVQAVIALGEDPAAGRWVRAEGSAMGALLGFQLGCDEPEEDRGAFAFIIGSGGSKSPNRMATVQAVPAAAGHPWPLPEIALESAEPTLPCGSPGDEPTEEPSEEPTEDPSEEPSDEEDGAGGDTDDTAQEDDTSEDSGQTAEQDAERTVTRLAGPSRFSTAAAVSAETFEAPAPVVYIATGADFPDALAAGAAAVADSGPVLLTAQDRLPDAVASELDRLDPERIVVLGGTRAVSTGVEETLRTYAPVERLAGANRFDTAVAVAQRTFRPGIQRVVVATGGGFPDALAGAALYGSGPVLLTHHDHLPGVTADELARLDPTEVLVLGGSAAVDDGVIDEIAARTSAPVRRLAGPTRFDTAVEVSRAMLLPGLARLYVTTGEDFPDALSTGAAAGADGTGLLLVARDSAPDTVLAELDRLDPDEIVLVGGPASVSAEVEEVLATRSSEEAS